jgi:hypothetical protein
MRFEATEQATSATNDPGRELERQSVNTVSQPAESRALVVTETAAPQAAPVYRQAAFLAHLIATKEHAPQTRERRRAEPSEAIAAYRTVKELTV